MVWKVEVATTKAASSWTDVTAAVNAESLVVGGMAHEFGVGTGFGFDLDDDSASAVLPSRRVIRVIEDATTPDTTLFRGRIVSTAAGRGRMPVGNARQWDVELADYNQDFRGLRVDKWSRASETDRARILALRAAFMAGSPRASTNLATTYAPNTNLVTVAKKVYEATDPAGVGGDMIDQSGKVGFVTVDGEIFYDLPTSTAYAAGLAISDSGADSISVFAPLPPTRAGEWDGAEFYSGASLIQTNGVRVGPTNRIAAEDAHDFWQTTIRDDDVTRTTGAQALTAWLNEFAKDDVRFYCSLHLHESQVHLVKWGQTVNFRSAAAGITSDIGVRIVRLAWRPSGYGWWDADLELDYPMQVNPKRPRGAVIQPQPHPTPASVLTPGSLALEPFDEAVRPVPIVAANPTLPDNLYPPGATVSLTADGKIYRNVAGVWVKDVATSDLTGVINIEQLTGLVQEALANDPQNMLVNGGGEQGTLGAQATGWTFGNGYGLQVDNSQRKYGARALLLNAVTAVDSYSSQDVTVAADTIYVCSGWIKTGALPTGDAGWGALINIDSATAGAVTVLEVVGEQPPTGGPDVGLAATGAARDWTFVKVRCKFASAGTVTIYCQLGSGGAQSGQAWFDGLRFARESKVVADDIVAGAVTTLALAALAVTTGKLSVGAIPAGAGNAIRNPSFEDNDPVTGFPEGWTKDFEPVGAPTYGQNGTARSGAWSGFIAATATSGGSIASRAIPVKEGDVWFVGAAVLGSAASADGLYVRACFGTTDQFARGDAGVTITEVIPADGAITTAWAKKEGYVTVPAGKTWMRLAVYNYLPATACTLFVDDAFAERTAGGVRNVSSEVVIDSVGVTIINGKLTVANAGAVVIIDGTSNMFKIAAEGTYQVTATAGNFARTDVTLSGLGTLGAQLAHLVYLAHGTGSTDQRHLGHIFSPTLGPWGLQTWGTAQSSLNGSSQQIISLLLYNGFASGSITVYGKYYVLKEAAL